MKNKKLILLSMIIISIFTIKNTYAKSYEVKDFEYYFAQSGLTFTNEHYYNNMHYVDVKPNNDNYYSYLRYIGWANMPIVKDSNSFQVPFSINDLNSDETLYCANEFTQVNSGLDLDIHYVTTYADNSNSNVNGTIVGTSTQETRYCNQWKLYKKNISINVSYVLNDNTRVNCSIINSNNEFVAVCPISKNYATGNSSIKEIDIQLVKKESDTTTNLRVSMSRKFAFEIDSQGEIIKILNEIKNKMNEDISEEDKEQPNTANFENSKQQEENIKNSISNANPNDITFNTDLTATSKIWEIVTNFLNTNSKVMGLMISILSLGVIKMILNR